MFLYFSFADYKCVIICLFLGNESFSSTYFVRFLKIFNFSFIFCDMLSLWFHIRNFPVYLFFHLLTDINLFVLFHICSIRLGNLYRVFCVSVCNVLHVPFCSVCKSLSSFFSCSHVRLQFMYLFVSTTSTFLSTNSRSATFLPLP